MSREVLPGAQVPSLQLEEELASRYVERLQRILRAGRTNTFYPDARLLREHVGPLHPDVNQGLYSSVQVDIRTGLPTYREWTRVQTDVTIAADQLRQLGPRAEIGRKAREQPQSIWPKMLKKHQYYEKISGMPIAPLGEMTAALRRIDRVSGRASFHVTLDKLDATGTFVRYTIDLEQAGRLDRDNAFEVDEREVATQSADFEGLIYKFTSLDAEFTFVKLATLGDLAPERVSKGTVGPFWFDFTRAPEAVKPIVDSGGFVACFSLDTAAVDIAEQRNNDPFASLAEDRLTEESRGAYREAKRRFGYRVFKDRKFVVRREDVDAMRAICEARGTRNIVYGI